MGGGMGAPPMPPMGADPMAGGAPPGQAPPKIKKHDVWSVLEDLVDPDKKGDKKEKKKEPKKEKPEDLSQQAQQQLSQPAPLPAQQAQPPQPQPSPLQQ
jgi:hypothetical protein